MEIGFSLEASFQLVYGSHCCHSLKFLSCYHLTITTQGADEVTASSEEDPTDHEETATIEAMETGESSTVGNGEAVEAKVEEEEEKLKAVSEVEAKPTSSKKVHPLFGRLSVFSMLCFMSAHVIAD